MVVILNENGEGYHPLAEPIHEGGERTHDIGPVSTDIGGDIQQELDGVDDDQQETPEIHSDTDTPDDLTGSPDITEDS